MKGFPFILVVLVGLAACAQGLRTPQQHVMADGTPCHAIGPWYGPIWVSPDGNRACPIK